MLPTIALFELRARLSRLSAYIYCALFFAFAFLMMIAAGGAFAGISVGLGTEKVFINSPFSLDGLIGVISYFALLVVAAAFGQAVHQDFETNSYGLFFTAPVSKTSYLGGRFVGAFLFMALVLSSIGLGLWAGTQMPFIDKSLLGPTRAAAYLWPYATMVLPNLLILGAIFFSLAVLARRMTPVYVAGVVLFMGYMMAGQLMSEVEVKFTAGLLDPFGMRAGSLITEYWTVAEKNSLLVPLRGLLALNRLLWLAVASSLFAFTTYRFRFAHEGGASRGGPAAAEPVAAHSTIIPSIVPAPDGWDRARLVARLTWLDFKHVVASIYFLVIVLASVLFFAVVYRTLGNMYGTNTHPLTYMLLEVGGGSFSLFMLIIITLYSGELVWRERDAKIDQINDAMPTPVWLPLLSKLSALLLVVATLLALEMACSVAIQTFKGYFKYEFDLYLKQLFGLRFVDYGLLCVLSIAVQAIIGNKYLGHFVMVLYYLSLAFMSKLNFEHNLYRFGESPELVYSDMNRYGHLLRPVLWFNLYWSAFAVLLGVLAHLSWIRGLETGFGTRLRLAVARFSTPLRRLAAAAALSFIAIGAFIFYNANVLNKYETAHDREVKSADYERIYKNLAAEPQPRVTSATVRFDLHPERLDLRVSGTYALKNKSGRTVRAIYVNLPDEVEISNLALGALGHPTAIDRRFGVHTFDLKQALKPGAATKLDFDLLFRVRGFKNKNQNTSVVANGTFFHSTALLRLGYIKDAELTEDNIRKKYGLAPKERMPDINDRAALKDNYITPDADWINFEATINTSPDQFAIAPGYLQREWTENGRRWFHYKMDAKILHFFSVLSARYQVKRDRWKEVSLEIYHHAGHTFNLDRMMDGMKEALEYCSTQFGPYQHRQLRIIEFPRYQSFAQAFPNTVPYSESVGFIARVNPKNEKDVDYPFYITAHEVAHQWWAHQVIGGRVQGATVMSETLSQYTALMVMKKRYGPGRMKRFLRYELERYLQGRSVEKKKEVPLIRVENQAHIHYNKGSLAMYALQDYIGEAAVNRALSAYLKATKFSGPPYTNALELLAYIKKETPPHLHYLITDLFETITLYDNRALSATVRALDKGRYEVQLRLSSKKLRADELGVEKPVAVDDMVDIGALDDNSVPIFLEKRRLKDGETEISFVVDRLPAKAGIDPLNKLIDRVPDDNVVRVSQR